MAQKKITDLTLRSDFDDTCNIPVHDATQTWRATGAQLLTYFKAQLLSYLEPLLSVDPRKLQNVGVAASVGSSALTLALKTAAGSDASASDPIKIAFRHATLTNGTMVVRSVTGALSVVISSGSTLGHISAIATRFFLYAIDNAGTVELAVSTLRYQDGELVSTTAEGGAGAADSSSAIYSTTARSNVAVRLIAEMVSTQTTAGTWAAVPTRLSLAHGQTLNARISAQATGCGTSFTNAGTVVAVFGTKEWDTHNAYSTSTGLLTCPKAGKYRVTTYIQASGATGTGAVNNIETLRIQKNASDAKFIGSFSLQQTGSAMTRILSGSGVIDCAAGDTLGVAINNPDSTFTGVNSSSATWVSFEMQPE